MFYTVDIPTCINNDEPLVSIERYLSFDHFREKMLLQQRRSIQQKRKLNCHWNSFNSLSNMAALCDCSHIYWPPINLRSHDLKCSQLNEPLCSSSHRHRKDMLVRVISLFYSCLFAFSSCSSSWQFIKGHERKQGNKHWKSTMQPSWVTVCPLCLLASRWLWAWLAMLYGDKSIMNSFKAKQKSWFAGYQVTAKLPESFRLLICQNRITNTWCIV